MRERAPAKVNLVPPRRPAARRRPARALLDLRVARPRRRRRAERGRPRTSVVCPGVEGPNLADGGAAAFRERAAADAAAAARRRSRSGSRSRPAWAAAAPTPPRYCAPPTGIAGEPLDGDELRALARAPRRRRPEPGRAAPRARARARARSSSRSSCPPSRSCWCPQRRGPLHRRASTREARPHRRRLARGSTRTRCGRSPTRRWRRWRARLENDLEPAALALRPELARRARRAATRPARWRRASAAPARPASASSRPASRAAAGRAARIVADGARRRLPPARRVSTCPPARIVAAVVAVLIAAAAVSLPARGSSGERKLIAVALVAASAVYAQRACCRRCPTPKK